MKLEVERYSLYGDSTTISSIEVPDDTIIVPTWATNFSRVLKRFQSIAGDHPREEWCCDYYILIKQYNPADEDTKEDLCNFASDYLEMDGKLIMQLGACEILSPFNPSTFKELNTNIDFSHEYYEQTVDWKMSGKYKIILDKYFSGKSLTYDESKVLDFMMKNQNIPVSYIHPKSISGRGVYCMRVGVHDWRYPEPDGQMSDVIIHEDLRLTDLDVKYAPGGDKVRYVGKSLIEPFKKRIKEITSLE